MTEREKVIKSLGEISEYFYGCYRNAGGGTRACEKFHDWMCAADDAKEKLMDGDTVRVTRCADCRYWEPENAEEGDYSGHCRRSFGICYGQITDASWFCADGEREE